MLSRKISILFLIALLFINSSCDKILNPVPKPTDPTEASFDSVEDRGLIENSELDEASGLVYSNANPGYLWSFNDSNNPNKIFLFDSNGKGVFNFTLTDAPNRDWEAMGIFKELDGSSSLYVADIGDNNSMHSSYFIYWFKEPTVDVKQPNRTISAISKLEFKLSDGSQRDMEAMIIDQKTRDIFIISKREDQKKLYRISGDKIINGNVTTAEFIRDLSFSNPFSTNDQVKTYFYITDANISPDNTEILVRNYGEIYYWKRKTGESIAEALDRQARVVPSYTRYALLANGKGEPQGEGVSFSTAGDGYYTISESADGTVPIHLYFFKKK